MPLNPIAPDSSNKVSSPVPSEPVVRAGGMKVVQPVSENVIPEPILPRAEELVDSAQRDERLNVESTQSQSYQPWNHRNNDGSRIESPFRGVSKSPTLKDRTEIYARNDAIATWLIVIVGLLVIGQAAYALIGVYTGSEDKEANGFTGVVYAIQALLGLGFVVRIETARRLLVWFTALILAFNIYTFMMASSAMFTLMGTTDGFLTGALTISSQLIVPCIVLIALNLRSVKSAFGQ